MACLAVCPRKCITIRDDIYNYYNALHERNGDTDPARIVIGKDTRRSSYMFEYSLVAGLTAWKSKQKPFG